MSYCVVECGITYETDFKDTDALDAAIKQILKADVEGIEKYWDLDESKRTEADLASVHLRSITLSGLLCGLLGVTLDLPALKLLVVISTAAILFILFRNILESL